MLWKFPNSKPSKKHKKFRLLKLVAFGGGKFEIFWKFMKFKNGYLSGGRCDRYFLFC